MGVHLYTNGAWTDSGRIYRNSLNLFDYSTIETGYRIQWNDGQPYADTSAIMSDYISVAPESYSISELIVVVGYDVNYGYVGVYIGSGRFSNTLPSQYINQFTIPNDSTVKYVKLLSFANTTGQINSSTMLNIGSTIPYEPYNVVDWYTNTGRGYTSGAWT